MKRSASLATIALLILGATSTVRAETYVGGVICDDTTWNLAGSPYIVSVDAGGPIVVGCDATLTIDAGVEVRFEPALALLVGWSAWGPGTLVARGTEQSPILFTSDQPSPAPGDWGRIDFLDQAADATFDGNEDYQRGCILEHVIVEYAGSGDYAGVNAEQSAPYLSYCEVRENLKRGIGVYSAPPLRIENCYVHDNQDGGIYFDVSSGSNTLTGNTISDNSAFNGGGGIYLFGGGNTLSGNTITGNSASGGVDASGGGIYFLAGSNTLTANTISGNTASGGAGGGGGGIMFYFSGSNTLSGNTISGNTAPGVAAGGIYFHSSSSNTMTSNTISGNSANDAGGIYFDGGGSNTLTGNTISGNSASGDGGGITFQASDTNTLTGNRISGNSADDAGGIRFLYSDSNTLTDNNIEDNTADSEGGAIFLYDSDNNALADNTIRFNHTTAGQTGGIYVSNGSEWLSLNGGPEAYNTICCNDGYDLYNNNGFYGGDARNDIDARNVYWCTDDTGVIQAHIYDFFDDASRAMVLWDPYVWSPPAGDLNCDGAVNAFDIEPFLVALFDPASYNAQYPDCDIHNADLNGDCSIDAFDIEPFLELLFGP